MLSWIEQHVLIDWQRGSYASTSFPRGVPVVPEDAVISEEEGSLEHDVIPDSLTS